METICCACMCYGRKLYSIGETGFHDLYKQILNEIQIYDMSQLCVHVCWECKSLLRRFHRFKDQVKNSYQCLLQHKKLLSPPKPKQSNLQIQLVTSIAYPPIDVKIEGPDAEDSVDRPDLSVEVEIKSELEEHCEPETFVNNLDLEMPRKRGRVPSVDKVHKEKLKKKLKEGKKSKFKKKLQLEKKRRRVSSDSSVSDVSVARQSVASDAEVKEESTDFKSDVDRLVENNVDKINTPKKKLKDPKKTKLKKKTHLEKKRRVSSDTSVSDVSVARQSVASDAEVKEELAKVDYELETELVMDNNVNKVVDILNGQVDKAVRKRSHKENLPDKPQCVECGKMFSSKKTYRYHLNVLHKGQNRYPCPRCGKIYQWKSNLGRHMRSHRARDSGELYCETCDKRFASVATFRQHLRVSRQHVSESEFRFMCNECGMKFVNKTRLRDHIDWEHLKKIKFKCQMCNKPFKCHTSLYVHMQNVHRNKEKKDNLCHVCGKSYQNAAKLKYHIVAMHTSETPYQCAQCSAAFGWYSSLYRHVREVHYKMKLQPKRAKKVKKLGSEILPSLVPQTHNAMQPGPA